MHNLQLHTFHMLKRGSAQTTHVQTCFQNSCVGKPRGLSIKDVWQSMLVQTALALSGSENKVKLIPTSSNTFEWSDCSDNKFTPRIEQNSIYKHLGMTIYCTRFQECDAKLLSYGGKNDKHQICF